MPLLCIILLALLLLPLSLACSSKKPLTELQNDYIPVVQTDINNTKRCIATLLPNSNCTELRRRPPRCSADNPEIVSTLHTLTCKMMRLRLNCTTRLTTSLQLSIPCPCHQKPTQGPVGKRTRAVTRRRRSRQKGGQREKRTICKAPAILSAIMECYEILNTILAM